MGLVKELVEKEKEKGQRIGLTWRPRFFLAGSSSVSVRASFWERVSRRAAGAACKREKSQNIKNGNRGERKRNYLLLLHLNGGLLLLVGLELFARRGRFLLFLEHRETK